MKQHVMLAFAVGTVLGLVGCGKSSNDKAEAGLTEWKNKMCACKDLACADKVHEDYKKWENDVLEPMFKGKKKADIPEKLMTLDSERKDCRRKLRDAAKPADGAAPPAGGEGAPAGSAAAPAAPAP